MVIAFDQREVRTILDAMDAYEKTAEGRDVSGVRPEVRELEQKIRNVYMNDICRVDFDSRLESVIKGLELDKKLTFEDSLALSDELYKVMKVRYVK